MKVDRLWTEPEDEAERKYREWRRREDRRMLLTMAVCCLIWAAAALGSIWFNR